MGPLHLGIDDTDSKEGLCTTHLTSILVERLLSEGVVFIDYPNLIRLNPNIPWKTRGNAATALRLMSERPDVTFEAACRFVKEYSESNSEANPSVAGLFSDRIPTSVRQLGQRALWDVVKKKEATAVAKECGIRVWSGGDGRGIVGALAAIGNPLEGDHTFEVLLYREPRLWGSKRRVDAASVFQMDRETAPGTFNNVDLESRRILVTPRGPDPVLMGIRGASPEAVHDALAYVRLDEPVTRYMIVRTNQGTGAHLAHRLDSGSLRAFRAGFIRGAVGTTPRVGRGGHVYFQLRSKGRMVNCACYEPAASLRRVVASLVEGDYVEVGGGVRRRSPYHPMVLNLEYVRLLRLAQDRRWVNPACPSCHKRMVSQGRRQGFRCDGCGFRDKFAEKTLTIRARACREALYLPPPRSQRHLTKPLQRLGRETVWRPAPLIRGWFGAGFPLAIRR